MTSNLPTIKSSESFQYDSNLADSNNNSTAESATCVKKSKKFSVVPVEEHELRISSI